jgi:hypothetical protein
VERHNRIGKQWECIDTPILASNETGSPNFIFAAACCLLGVNSQALFHTPPMLGPYVKPALRSAAATPIKDKYFLFKGIKIKFTFYCSDAQRRLP